MLRRLQERMTYANVIATIALFVALGGTSYAAVTLPRDSVGARQLREGSVGSSEVRNRSLQLRDLSPRAQDALIRAGRRTSAPGAPGAPGAVSQAVEVTYKTASVIAAVAPVEDTSITPGTATCDPGQRVVGGGVKLADPYETFVSDSYPDQGGRAWSAHVGNDDEQSRHSFEVIAICAP